MLCIGDYAEEHAAFRWKTVLHRELEIIGSNASAAAWPEAVQIASQGRIPLERLVTQRFPAARFAEAVEQVRRSQGIKVVLLWDAPPSPRQSA